MDPNIKIFIIAVGLILITIICIWWIVEFLTYSKAYSESEMEEIKEEAYEQGRQDGKNLAGVEDIIKKNEIYSRYLFLEEKSKWEELTREEERERDELYKILWE